MSFESTGARVDLHPRVWRRVRGGGAELRADVHPGQRPPGAQGHTALGHGRGVPPLQQDGAAGLVPGDLRGVPVQPPQARRPPGDPLLLSKSPRVSTLDIARHQEFT